MNTAAFADMIRDRLTADTGSGGLFNATPLLASPIYYAAMPTTAAMPYAVFSFVSDVANNCFQKDVREIRFQLSVFMPRVHATISDPMLRGSQILDRIYGDSANGSVPTYGLHRWAPTLSGGWTAGGAVQCGPRRDEHIDDTYAWVLEFYLPVSR